MAVSTKMVVFWVVALCRLVQIYQSFRGPFCLHHQGNEWAARKKSVRDKDKNKDKARDKDVSN
jgi:hypothetical protein